VFYRTLQKKATEVDNHALVSQRIKRLAAIRLKLQLNSGMALSRMQDIGGCRAVLRSVPSVRRLIEVYRASALRHTLRRETDYIAQPRKSGYRGIHLIYRYRGRNPCPYDGMEIEMQIRSRLQHAWATAVETVGTFLRQALKSSQGEENWLRFFALMGSAIALKESSPLVSDTPTDENQLIAELRQITDELQVESRLQAYGVALRTATDKELKGAKYFLLELNTTEKNLNITSFASHELEKATSRYMTAEKAIVGQPANEAVLVSVDSLATLRSAYPSYFLDTTRFLQMVHEAISDS